ncbi:MULTISPECIES: Arc family DNA-binding protein [Stenotrophomonas]|uniref:Arc family DNA-binding protein n=1 Tax=Stenotrophomonas TaxID=40323 RepID=UPI0013DC919F|nr:MULTISPECIES: Arc family DNA-binding protein [Stenotrophomonas]
MQDRKTKTSDTNPFGLRMDPGVRERAQAKAHELERSLNWTINHLLKQALGLKEPSP